MHLRSNLDGASYGVHSNTLSSYSHRPMARTKNAEAPTTSAAKSGGMSASSLDLPKSRAGTHTTSNAGPSVGTLTLAPPPPPPHPRENAEAGDTAQTNAASGANDATATDVVRSAVHAAAWRRSGRGWRSAARIAAGTKMMFMCLVGDSGEEIRVRGLRLGEKELGD